jgi:hypothetical protein
MSRRAAGLALAIALVLAVGAVPGAAQGYRALIEVRGQTVALRGWALDSVPAGDVSATAAGAFVSPQGFAVDCRSADPFCYFYRPGERQNARPVSAAANVTIWGLGVTGLSLHANVRAVANADDLDWAGSRPTVQLWEGYARYETESLEIRAGRQTFASRLGLAGFDGGQVILQSRRAGLYGGGYFGFGLARNTSTLITSDVVNPLGEFRPPERHLVFGAMGGWSGGPAELRIDWQREVDRAAEKQIADRLALSGTVRAARRVSLTGGAEYDLAQGWLGSADVSLRYTSRAVTASGGYRRYRPHFDLWSIWSAFSPVAYNAAVGSLAIAPVPWLRLRGRGEYYGFENTDAATPLADVETDGYRWSAGATVTRLPGWSFDLGFTFDHGVGARGDGWDAMVGWTPTNRLSLRAFGATLDRPLELRFDDARVRWVGIGTEWRARDAFTVGIDGTYIYEERQRPDAASFDWRQARVVARVTYVFGSATADGRPLPRAIERMPSVTGQGR